MIINFNEPIKELDGREIKDPKSGKVVTIGQAIAQVMWADSKNGLKFYDWAPKIYNNLTLDLDISDKELLKGWLENSQLTTAVKGPALKILLESK